MSKETPTIEEQIQAWKKKHGDVFQITVEDKTAYLKKPDRNTLASAMAMGKTNPMKTGETILKSCWLGGDDEIKSDDSYFFGALQQIDQLIEIKAAEIKKL